MVAVLNRDLRKCVILCTKKKKKTCTRIFREELFVAFPTRDS